MKISSLLQGGFYAQFTTVRAPETEPKPCGKGHKLYTTCTLRVGKIIEIDTAVISLLTQRVTSYLTKDP